MTRVGAAAALACAVASLTPGASPPQRAAFKASVGLVVLDVRVKDAAGHSVTTLDRDAFSIFENGAPQQMTIFNKNDAPLSLGLLIDNSGSMRGLRPQVEQAALALVRSSNPDDEVFVVNFADTPKLDVALTTERRLIEEGIARQDSIGGTALRDAVDMAGTYLDAHGTHDRKALVVISDGYDNASEVPLAQVQRAVQRDGVTIYGVGVAGADTDRARAGRRELTQLSEPTGGTAYFPATIADIDLVMTDLAQQLRTQYTLAYTPRNQAPDGSYRHIRVNVRSAVKVKVQTRDGYWAIPR